jgi:hypothetical protein
MPAPGDPAASTSVLEGRGFRGAMLVWYGSRVEGTDFRLGRETEGTEAEINVQRGAPDGKFPIQQALSRLMKVMSMIWRSSSGFQFSRYQRSHLMRSVRSVSPRSPFTCAQPVIPGFAL